MNKIIVFDLATEGLEPFKHRIIGITTKTEEEERIFTERDEKKILEQFWLYITEKGFNKVVGFNSENFDIPMLIIRSIKHKIKMDEDFRKKSIDLRQLIFNGEQRKGKLEDFKELLGINFEENGYRKMHMSLLWEARHLTKLRDFLSRDVKITWCLYEYVREAGLC